MKKEIEVGDFIDRIKALDILELIVFIHAWEETAPIFHGENYRLSVLTENFVLHLLDEIDCFTYFLLNGFKDRPRLSKLALARMNSVLKKVSMMADNHVKTGQITQITVRG